MHFYRGGNSNLYLRVFLSNNRCYVKYVLGYWNTYSNFNPFSLSKKKRIQYKFLFVLLILEKSLKGIIVVIHDNL